MVAGHDRIAPDCKNSPACDCLARSQQEERRTDIEQRSHPLPVHSRFPADDLFERIDKSLILFACSE